MTIRGRCPCRFYSETSALSSFHHRFLATAHAETGNVDEAVKWQTKCLDESTPHARTELQERV